MWTPSIRSFVKEYIRSLCRSLASHLTLDILRISNHHQLNLDKIPSLLPALHHLFIICWLSQTVPSAREVTVIKLIGKKCAKEDPSLPSNFRPIALTSCVGKIYTSLLKNRWMAYMLDNKYLNTAVQKAFVDGIPGCTEHHLKRLSILNEVRQKHKSLCICRLDLANAFGSVHHNLIEFTFRHYHAPPAFINVITNLYQNLHGITKTIQYLFENHLLHVNPPVIWYCMDQNICGKFTFHSASKPHYMGVTATRACLASLIAVIPQAILGKL